MIGMRLIFALISAARRPFASANPDPPAAAKAGISNTKPHGIAVFTLVTTDWEASNSLMAVENQNVAIVRSAMTPATG